jgi:nitroreductase
MDTFDAIATRHSTRSFKPTTVPRQMVEKNVDAGRLAATARNDQPWDFVVVTDARVRRQIADLTDHGKFITEAPVCVAVFCRATQYYVEDGSAASQAMLTAAAALGVQSCWVSGDKRPYAPSVEKLLGVPAGHKLLSLLPMGYEDVAETRQPKRTLAQVLHWEKF